MPTVIAPRYRAPALRTGVAVALLLLIGHRIGARPFADGARSASLPMIATAVGLTAITTVCSALRWRIVSRSLGVDIPLTDAVGAYYRSQFLNSVLPGGVVGDVQRAVTHGRRVGDTARGLRAVVWERLCGQGIQAIVTIGALLLLPSPLRRPLLLAVTAGAVIVLSIAVGAARRSRRPTRTITGDLTALLPYGPQLGALSVVVVAGHTSLFVVAARAGGSTVPTDELVALLLLVQTVMVVPLSVGGWGPREGAAAWAFAAAGSGAAAGVAATTTYAVLVLAALTPGAALLLLDAVRRRRPGASGACEPCPTTETLEVARG